MSDSLFDIMDAAREAYHAACAEFRNLDSEECDCYVSDLGLNPIFNTHYLHCGGSIARKEYMKYLRLTPKEKKDRNTVYYDLCKKVVDTYESYTNVAKEYNAFRFPERTSKTKPTKKSVKAAKKKEETTETKAAPSYDTLMENFALFVVKDGMASFEMAKKDDTFYEDISMDVNKLLVFQLKLWAKALQIPSYSKMRRAELVEILEPMLTVLAKGPKKDGEDEEDVE